MGHEHKKNKNQRARKEVSQVYAEERDKEIIHELKHGKPVEKKSNDQLFIIDKKATIKEKGLKIINTRNNKKELAKNRLTRAESILKPNENVEPIGKNTAPNTYAKHSFDQVIDKEVKHIDLIQRQLAKKDKKVVAKKARNEQDEDEKETKQQLKKQQNKRKVDEINHDLWADEEEVDSDDFVAVNMVEEVDRHARPQHKPLVKNAQSVELPSAGMSYRPKYDDHQDTLRGALNIERRTQKYVNKVVGHLELQSIPEQVQKKLKLDLELEKAAEEKRAKERAAAVPVLDKNGNPMTVSQAASVNERRTLREKKKSIRRSVHQNNVSKRKNEIQMAKDIDNAEKMMKKLESHEQKQEKARADRAIIRDRIAQQSKKIDNGGVDAITESFLLSDQLPDSLVNLSNPSFKPLKDRFRSFQKRNLVTNQVQGIKYSAKYSDIKRYSYDNTKEAEYVD